MKYETIAAIASGITDSGIGIVRISGEDAVQKVHPIFRSPSGKKILDSVESHKLTYGYIVDILREDAENSLESDNWKNYIIDECMAVVMKAPRSFTGEDTVEIQCHGGVLVMKKILDLVLHCGVRMAQPGEFTKRAFLNGRMDLSRAEAVIDVIHSQNEYALSASVKQLRGKLSSEVQKMRADILYELAFIESALDDPEHISLDGYKEKLSDKNQELLSAIQKLISTAENGKLLKEGISMVIVGKPNAGKSSLMNLLVGEERAIVTDIAGTTRDILQETVILGGIHLHIIDTAGVRDTFDTVEKIGVEKTKKYAKDADLIVYMVDSSVDLDENDHEIMDLIRDKKTIVLMNKSDLDSKVSEEDLREIFAKHDLLTNIKIIKTSMKEGIGLEAFEGAVKELFFEGGIKTSTETVITNMRHKEALQEAYDSLTLLNTSLENDMPEDFYSIDLMSTYASLGRIIGEEVDDDLVEEIFSKFCMGK